jgi:hypothetical protein
MTKPFNILAVAILSLLLVSVGLAQQSTSSNSPDSLAPTNCEMNAAMLSRVPQQRFQGEAESDAVIAIARLGAREYSREINRRRLFNVKYYLEQYRGLNPKRIVVAEGERVKGYGRVELYVEGVLLEVLVAEYGKDLCVSCCGPNDDFYPERTRRKRNK